MLDIAALDALDLRVIVDNETDGLSSVDEGLPQISEIADRASRLPVHVIRARPSVSGAHTRCEDRSGIVHG